MTQTNNNNSNQNPSTSDILNFSPTAKSASIIQPDAANLISFAPAPDMSNGPIIIDEEELARDFSSAFHVAAEKRDSREFPIPDLYKDETQG